MQQNKASSALVGRRGRDCMFWRIVLLLTVFLVASDLPGLKAQYTVTPENMAWGNSASVSNDILTIVSYASSSGLPFGTKMNFVLNAKTTIVCEECGLGDKPVGVSEIENYHRIRVEYVQRSNAKVATAVFLSAPIRVSPTIPPVAAHAAEAEAHMRRGLQLHNKGDLNGAVAEYRTAIQLNPYYESAHNNLGNALDDQGKHAEAIQEYNAALDLSPFYKAAHYNLAIALERAEDPAGAESHYLFACPTIQSKYCPPQQPTQQPRPWVRGGMASPGHRQDETFTDINGRRWDSKKEFDRICSHPLGYVGPSTCPH
jgi:hypothetical protein